MPLPEPPAGSDVPLVERYDALLVDLDGVVQLDDEPIGGAAEALAAARSAGLGVLFVTNNAARTPEEVADRLGRVGVPATPDDVVTSSQAAAALLRAELGPGEPVLVVGGRGLRAALEAADLTVVASADDAPRAVAQGWGPDITWADLAEACLALRAGARWVATNRDLTLPSPRGPLPGSGSLVAALVAATGREPDTVAGKPQRPLFDTAVARLGARAPLVVGDRLDTDIAGAFGAGLPSLLVLTGVSRPRDLLGASPESRPTYVGADLGALGRPQPPVDIDGATARCGGWTVTANGTVDAAGSDPVDGLRAAAALAWAGSLSPERYDDVLEALNLD